MWRTTAETKRADLKRIGVLHIVSQICSGPKQIIFKMSSNQAPDHQLINTETPLYLYLSIHIVYQYDVQNSRSETGWAGVLDTVSQFCSWSTPTGHSRCLPNQTPNYSHQLISIILKGLKWVCQITRETSKMCTIEGPSKNRVGKHSARKSRCASETSRGP